MTITGTELAEVLADAARSRDVPGAVAGVVVGGEPIVATFGVTNAKRADAVVPSTRFQVGSVSKTIASAALMLLVQDGLVGLDDPVARHLPALGPTTGLETEAMTIEHCLSHQSGFDGDELFVRRSNDLADLATARRLFAPGTGFSYSNAGFSIVGAVIEAVSGRSFESFVRERLFGPLGMRSTCFRADDAVTSSVASPHWVFEGTAHVLHGAGWQPGWELQPVDWPAGGAISDAPDLLRWARFQWTGTSDDGHALLDPASLSRLHTPVVRSHPFEEVALDWFVETIDGATTIGHGGVTVGYVTDLVLVPEQRFACIALTNAANGASVCEAVRRWALEHGAGLVERDPEPDATIGAHVDVARLRGRYAHAFATLELEPGPATGTVVLRSSARDDLPPGSWQPPIDDPVTFAFATPDFAVSIDAPGPVRTLCAPADDGADDGWILLNGRRAPRLADGRGRHAEA